MANSDGYIIFEVTEKTQFKFTKSAFNYSDKQLKSCCVVLVYNINKSTNIVTNVVIIIEQCDLMGGINLPSYEGKLTTDRGWPTPIRGVWQKNL